MHFSNQKLRLFLIALLFGVYSPVLAQEKIEFLEGFPDFPLLDCCTEVSPEDRMVFDTPAGTVAETFLLSSDSLTKTLNAYQNAMTGLGWICHIIAEDLNCTQENMQVSLKPAKIKAETTVLLLSLSPESE